MRRLERLIPPPLVALILGFGMWALARVEAPLGLPRALTAALALALAVAGAAVAAAGAVEFRRAGANIDPHHVDRGEALATSGVYRFTRNPMYLGMALVLCGYAVYLARPAELIAIIAFIAFLARFQIAPEERAMRAKFGADYARYAAATRRWL